MSLVISVNVLSLGRSILVYQVPFRTSLMIFHDPHGNTFIARLIFQSPAFIAHGLQLSMRAFSSFIQVEVHRLSL